MLFIKRFNFIVYLTVALAVGFGFGYLVKSKGLQDDLLTADISKTSLYSNQKSDPAVDIIEEKLKNDTAFLNDTQCAISVLKERMSILNDLTAKTIGICSGIPEFEDMEITFTSLQSKAYNTDIAIENAKSGLKKVASGKKAPEYEIASNNMYIGYQKIQNQLAVGKTFVDIAKTYVENNEGETADKISRLIAEWSLYCAQDAALNRSDEELAYWEVKVNELDHMDKLSAKEITNSIAHGNSARLMNHQESLMNVLLRYF